MTPRFAIFYADGCVYEGGGSTDELIPVTIYVSRDWLDAPPDRVLGVVAEHPLAGRVVHRGAEWFYPTAHGEYGVADDIGAWLRKLGGTVKRGEYVSTAEMGSFWRAVKNYLRIPRGTEDGRFPEEREEGA